MNIKKVIGIGIVIWIIGVSLFTLSYYIPLLEDTEKQANAVLFISVPLLVWFGAKQYFKNGLNTLGYLVGLGFFLDIHDFGCTVYRALSHHSQRGLIFRILHRYRLLVDWLRISDHRHALRKN